MPGPGRRKRRIGLSRVYSFACLRPRVEETYPGEGPGFTRVVHVNDEQRNLERRYRDNYVSTTKYNAVTFLPKALYEQFRRVANVYFLLAAALSLVPSLTPFKSSSLILPLVFVVGVSMIKEAIEDMRRKQQDKEVNNRKVKVLRDGVFVETEWKHLAVGNIVKVEKDSFFPADLLLLSSSYDDGICYVETMNLDGETNLKLKQGLEVTTDLQEEDFATFGDATIKCEDPNPHLYTFIGTLEYQDEQHPLSPQQILLRDSKLRNTEYIYGAVIFTGHDSKVMMNATDPPSKRSKVEKKMDKIIYFLFGSLVTISLVGTIGFGIITNDDTPNWWYLKPDDADAFFDPDRPALAAFLHFITALILYGYLIPISLYVSLEIVKILQCMFINQDTEMYYEEIDRPAQARTSNLNEELGEVDTILSDKTGTLTCNSMEFIKCSIAGKAYGKGKTEVEKSMEAKLGKKASEGLSSEEDSSDDNEVESETKLVKKVKGFNFYDKRLMNGNWQKQRNAETIRIFFRILAVCQTVIPDEVEGTVNYEAESPDEAAFVVAARELGFEFFKRTHTSVMIREPGEHNDKVEREYTVLNVLEFNSARKRMSVIVRTEEGKLYLFSKGADSVMFERLSSNGREFEDATRTHISKYADAGLRTLVLAYRELDEEAYKAWNVKFMEAKSTVASDRDEKVDAVTDEIERNLLLVGATAVEDRLQQGVPQCIDRLAQAGIKIWVLTGDKMETAINIGFACSLLRQGMKQIVITLDLPEINAIEAHGNKEALNEACRKSVTEQIEKGKQQVDSVTGGDDAFALICDGKSLTYALDSALKGNFLAIALDCASVICCRVSPKQKAEVTRLVKEGTGKTTLGIGDGANDVGMLQEADIGIGISGVEGMQAVMASDFAIGQFRFLERLLLVHGHWCYRRITTMICYFFYKNITFGLTLFYFEIYAAFSAQTAYNDWFSSLFNVVFTSLPVIAMGIFEQDVSARLCLKYPHLYQEGPQNLLFRWKRLICWMLNGVCSSLIIFFFTANILHTQAFREGGEVSDMSVFGAILYTCIIWVVNCQLALAVSYFTWIQHVLIWGSIAIWYIFLLVYGVIDPTTSTTAYKILEEACGPSPMYWLITLLVVPTALFPYFLYSAFQTRFFPTYRNIIQWAKIAQKGRDEELQDINLSAFPTSRHRVGVTARMEAALRHLKKKIHHNHHANRARNHSNNHVDRTRNQRNR